MRHSVIALLAGALLLAVSAFAGSRTDQPKVQKAVLVFNEPIKLLGVILRGEYIIVHDDERMAKGEDCTYVYARENGQQGKLVVSFHCIPVEREPVDHFTVVVGSPDPASNLPELLEYRFAGSTEGHKVPRPASANP
jgi:hypothetical protein